MAIQPVAPKQPLVNPETMQALLAGVPAQESLNALQPQLAQAAAMRGFVMPEGRTAGGVYQAANVGEVLGGVLGGLGAERKYNQLQSQAATLRGQATAGKQAGIEAEYQRMEAERADAERERMAKVEANRVAAAQNALYKQALLDRKYEAKGKLQDKEHGHRWNIATLKNDTAREQFAVETERKNAEREARNKALTSSYRTWVDTETGEMYNIARTREGTIDGDGNPISTKGKILYDQQLAHDKIGAKAFGRLKGPQQTAAINSFNAMKAINGITESASKLSEEDIAKLSEEGLEATLKAFTPSDFRQYVQSNKRGYSPAVKEYLHKVYTFSTDIRHDLFGAAVSKGEQGYGEDILPSATGIPFADRMARLKTYANKAIDNVKSIDSVVGTDIFERMPAYNEYSPQSVNAAQAPQAEVQTSSDLNTMSDAELEAEEQRLLNLIRGQ